MTKIAWRGARPLLSLLALRSACFAQSRPDSTGPEIVTDRPDVTESSTVVSKGSLQIENGATLTTDHGFPAFDLSETLIRLGVSTSTEVRLVVPNYLGGFTGSDATGLGDYRSGNETTARAVVRRL